jgi:hypothetical protein
MCIGLKEGSDAPGGVSNEGTKRNIVVVELRSVADRCAYATARSPFLVVRPAGKRIGDVAKVPSCALAPSPLRRLPAVRKPSRSEVALA